MGPSTHLHASALSPETLWIHSRRQPVFWGLILRDTLETLECALPPLQAACWAPDGTAILLTSAPMLPSSSPGVFPPPSRLPSGHRMVPLFS